MGDKPYSMAQMPVPVPRSRTMCAFVTGARASLPSNVRLNKWCWRSLKMSTSFNFFEADTYLACSAPSHHSEVHSLSVVNELVGDENMEPTSWFVLVICTSIFFYDFKEGRPHRRSIRSVLDQNLERWQDNRILTPKSLPMRNQSR